MSTRQYKYSTENMQSINLKYKREFIKNFERALKKSPIYSNSTKREFLKEQMLNLIIEQNVMSKELQLVFNTKFDAITTNFINGIETEQSKERMFKRSNAFDLINSWTKNDIVDIVSEWLIYSDSATTTFRINKILEMLDNGKLDHSKNENIIRYIKHSSIKETHLYL